jgi:hypothetical protein
MTRETAELQDIMAQCYGTEHYYREKLLLSYLYTDGVKTFAMNAGNGAFWFLQEVNGMIVNNKIRQSDDNLTTIHLKVKDERADIVMFNNDQEYIKHIGYTDCPEGDWLFYYFTSDNVLIWNGEY